jgi:hypothetical protein
MNVIFHAANFDSCHFVGASDAAEIWPQTLLKLGRDKTPALFRAPHAMQITRNKCVHGGWKNKRPATTSKEKPGG